MGRMVSPRQQDRSFNYILQFPDITRPRVFGQRFHDLIGKGEVQSPEINRNPLEELLCQYRNVF